MADRCATDSTSPRNGTAPTSWPLTVASAGSVIGPLSDDLNTWRADGETRIAPVDWDRINRQREQERRDRLAAIHAVRRFWAALGPMQALHSYLADKLLTAQGCGGVRMWRGQIVVPITDKAGRLMNVQLINSQGRKLFWKGAPVQGGCYVIDRPHAALTAICEGFATGLAVFQAMRHGAGAWWRSTAAICCRWCRR
jgi:phage/plasmid primase-like uncharacterized protein